MNLSLMLNSVGFYQVSLRFWLGVRDYKDFQYYVVST